MNNKTQPNIGLLYVQGFAVYLWFRLLALGEAILHFLLTPYRWAGNQLYTLWLKLKPWLVRHKRRLIWTAVALVLLGLAGGVVALYLWRGSFPALLTGVSRFFARRWRKATPLVVVATAPPEEAIPATPVDGKGQASR